MSESAWGAKVLPLLPGGIQVTNLGGGFYQLDFPRISQIGSNIVTRHVVPFPHKLIALYVKHVDASLDDASTSLSFSAKFGLRDNFNFSIASFTSDAADEMFAFRDGEGARNACRYEFNTNTTSGHYVYITMIVQALGGI